MSDLFLPARRLLDFAEYLKRRGWTTEAPEGEELYRAGRSNMTIKIVLWKSGDEGRAISAWSKGELRTFLAMYPEG